MSVAWSTASFVGFVAIFVVAYRFNRSDYHDSGLKSVVWALLLAIIWPVTLLAWLFGRQRFRTPFSPASR